MTHEDIVKALRICSDDNQLCGPCMYHNKYAAGGCVNRMESDAANIIEQQQSEIAEFDTKKQWLVDTFAEIDKESKDIS